MKAKNPASAGFFYKQLASRKKVKIRSYIILSALTKDVATNGKISVSHSQ